MGLNEFSIVWVDAYTYLSKTGISKHKHEFFHFIYVDSGTGEMTIAERSFTMQQGNIYLVSSFVEHSFFNNNDEPLKTFEIKFRLNNAQTESMIEKLPFCMNVKNYPVKSTLMTIIKEKAKGMPMSEEVVALNFRLLLIYLMRCYEQLNGNTIYNNERKSFSPKNYPEIDRVINYIHDNLTEEISLEKLAEISGFEKNYFLRKFKRQTNRTPMTFARDVRIEKSKELLRYSDMNISQIAFATGFSSVHYFSNVFLEYTGKRPLVYRNENKVK